MDGFLDRTLDEIKKGCAYDAQKDRYVCNICLRIFENGEVFKVGERFFNAEKAAEIHIREEHGSLLDVLMSQDKRYAGLTGNQKQLLAMMAAGLSDKDIAARTGTAAATVRHQRFMFREKARQAKLYLAIYELAALGKRGGRSGAEDKEDQEELIEVHGGAKMVDERYLTTKEEEETILSNMFSSLDPLKLKNLSPKEKKKIVILKKIAGQFERERKYSEKELNGILKDIYEDFATLRRYLIEYGFMDRTKDCKEYWLT